MTSTVPFNTHVQQSTESQVSTVPFALEPEIYGENTFVIDQNVNILLVAENLAAEAKYLINILKTTQPINIQKQFQIELRKTHAHDHQCSTYKMSLRINSLLWFKHHTLNSSDVHNLEHMHNMGSRYVEKVKNETEQYLRIVNEDEIHRIRVTNSPFKLWCKTEQHGVPCTLQNDPQRRCSFIHYNWCPDENLGLTGECKPIAVQTGHNQKFLHTSKIDKYEEPVYYQCRLPIIKLNRQQVLCNFTVDPDFRIYYNKISKPSQYPYFIVAARKDATPVITLSPVKHCTDEEYVQTSDAWQAILQTLIYMKDQLKLDKLPLSRIYINFGKWMSQKADDPMHRNCHAHINIVLPSQVIDWINQLYQSKDKHINVRKLFPALVGSCLPPTAHRLDDLSELIEFMNYHMAPILLKRYQELMTSFYTLKNEIEEVKRENQSLKNIFYPVPDSQETDDLALSSEVAEILDTNQ